MTGWVVITMGAMSRSGDSLKRINALVDQENYRQALPLIERALVRAPSDPDLVALMSFVLVRTNSLARAEYFARRTVELLPGNAHAQHNLGNVLVKLGRNVEALPILSAALELAPQEPQVRLALCNALFALNRFASAAAVLREGLAQDPAHFQMLNNLAHTLHAMGRIEDALPILRRIGNEAADDLGFADAMCCVLNYAPGVTAQEIFHAHLHYGLLAKRGLSATPVPAPVLAPGQPLRVGLLSSDLRDHAVAYLIEHLLEFRDPARVRITCYVGPAKEDAVTDRLRARADVWKSLSGLTTGAAAELIRRDGTQVLIDLSGHTKGHMLQVMAQRAAPVQMTYTGYPNTTGLRSVDYRIVDSLTDPPGYERFATEKLLRLDPCFLSYRPPPDAPLPNELPAGESGAVTFGSFSSLLKLSTPLINLWARVLAATPGSRLMLKHFGLTEEAVREDVADRFVKAGIERERLLLLPPGENARQVLPSYQQIDIALDTLPYNGTTTICEAFLMGVPLVSMVGTTPPGRVALSMLSAVGLEDLCAADEEGYVVTAAKLAADRARLRRLRTDPEDGLRARFLRSAICDGRGFARRLEDAVHEAWRAREE